MLSSYWCGLPYPVAFVISLIHSCWLKAASPPVYLSLMKKNNLLGGVCGFHKANTYKVKLERFSAHVSFPRLSRHPPGTLRPGTIIYSSGRLRGFLHMSLLRHPVCCSHALPAAKNKLYCPRCCRPKPADRSCSLTAAWAVLLAWPCSRRETWSSQWETTAQSQQPVCWHWGCWRAEHGRFPKKRSWNGKGGKVKWEREAGKDVCSKKTVMQAGGSSPLAQIDNPVKTV